MNCIDKGVRYMGITLEKEYVVLISIVDIGGKGSKREVLDNINEKKYMNFSEEDLKIKNNRNEIKWRNDLAFTRKHLQTKDYIDGSEKNNWKITDKGMEYLFALTERLINNTSSFIKLTEVSTIRALSYYEECIFKELKQLEKTKEEISATILETDYERFVKARIGQGIFKNKLLKKESCCRICGMNDERLLIASHIKPWNKSNNSERLDGSNGFLLCPNHDALFDKGYITFDDMGNIIISSMISKRNYNILGIQDGLQIQIFETNIEYLKWHRLYVFKK